MIRVSPGRPLALRLLAPLVLALLAMSATAQSTRSVRAPVAEPAWNQLSSAQREALAPLASDWDSYDRDAKKKWLEVAKKYPRLSDDGKQRLQTRMKDFARLTPEQRRTARENFQRAYELPLEQREARMTEYKNLPEDKRRELAAKAKERPQAAPKPPAPTTRSPAKVGETKQDTRGRTTAR